MARLFALVVMGVLCLFTAAFVIWLGSLPARIARRRHHPQVDAINAMSWLGLLLTGGVGWGLALVWALIRYDAGVLQASTTKAAEDAGTTTSDLELRIAKLEQLLASSAGRESNA